MLRGLRAALPAVGCYHGSCNGAVGEDQELLRESPPTRGARSLWGFRGDELFPDILLEKIVCCLLLLLFAVYM